MSDLTPVLQEMAARPEANGMLMPHEIRRAGERRRARLAMATATGVVALVVVAAGMLMGGVTRDESVGPAGRLVPDSVGTVSIAPLAGPGRPGDLPQGTYRYTLTRQELRAHGLTSLDSRAEAGVWTWTLDNGRWSYRFRNVPTAPSYPIQEHVYIGDHCAGYYDVAGHRIKFTTVTAYAHGVCADPVWFGSWSRAGNGLQMRNEIYYSSYVFAGRPWERIPGNG